MLVLVLVCSDGGRFISINPAAPAPKPPRRLAPQLPFDDFEDEFDSNDDLDGNRLMHDHLHVNSLHQSDHLDGNRLHQSVPRNRLQWVLRERLHAPAFSATDYQGGEVGGGACQRGGPGSPFSDAPRYRPRSAPASVTLDVTFEEQARERRPLPREVVHIGHANFRLNCYRSVLFRRPIEVAHTRDANVVGVVTCRGCHRVIYHMQSSL